MMSERLHPTGFKKTALASMVAITLTACGGGGGGGSSDGGSTSGGGSSQDSVTTQAAAINTGESSNDTASVAGTITEIEPVRTSSGVTVTDTDPSSPTTIAAVAAEDEPSSDTSTVYIVVDELQNNADARYRIHHELNGNKYITTLTINAENTSALDDVAKAEHITGLSIENLALADERRLSNALLQLEYVAGVTDASTMDATKTQIAGDIDSSIATTQSVKDALTKTLADYKAGSVGEQTLIQSIAQMDDGLQDLELTSNAILQRFDTTLDAVLDASLPANMELTYDAAQGRYTRFTNDTLGQYTETGEWQFASAYDWLNAALPMNSADNR